MAEAAVEFLLGNLQQLLLSYVEILKQDEQDIQIAMTSIEAIENEGQRVRAVSRSGIDLRYKLEDAIEHLGLVSQSGGSFYIARRLFTRLPELYQTYEDIKKIREGVEYLSDISTALTTSAETADKVQFLERLTNGHPVEENLLGREDDLKDLRSHLAADSPCRVVVICGMGGLGKSSLAWKLYQELKSEYVAAFVQVTHNPNSRRIMEELHDELCLYRQQSEEPSRSYGLDIQDLIQDVLQIQRQKRCLVVLDDVWSRDVGDITRIAFPEISDSGSKLLITTREADVAEAVNKFGAEKIHFHRLRNLIQDEGGQLLQINRHLQDIEAKQNWDEIMKEAAKLCEGVPLAIINFLQYMESKHTQEWSTIRRELEFHVRKSQEIGSIDSISKKLLLSYDNLPNHLKPCFLYLGNFARDPWMDAEKLCLFWVAEGFIPSLDNAGGATLKDVAVWYLRALARKSMVEVHEEEIPTFIGVKSWWINAAMKQISLLKGQEQGFFEVVDLERNREQMPEYQSYRLVINLDRYRGHKFPLSDDEMKHIRCLILRTKNTSQENAWPRELSILISFKHLRILDFDGVDFRVIRLPERIGKLIHLRFLSFKGCFLPELPSSIGNLRSLLVLDLRVQSECKTIIPDILRKLKKLMHLFFPKSFGTRKDRRLRLKGMTELESIINFNSANLHIEDLFQLPKLRYVSSKIEGNMEDIECIYDEVMNISPTNSFLLEMRNFDCYTEERHTLLRGILKWSSLTTFTIEGCIRRLPPHNEISSNLAKIKLIGSELLDDPMEILEKLEKLAALVLDDEAFVGKKMTCSASGFRGLRHLKLLNLPNLEEWIVKDGAMPKLSKLVIKHCGELTMEPEELGLHCSHQEAKISGMRNKSKSILGKESATIEFE